MREQLLERETTPETFMLGEAAEGLIGQDRDCDELFTEALGRFTRGEFMKSVDHSIVCGCIDGRCGGKLRASSAGGTYGLAAARDLSRFPRDRNVSMNDALSETIERLQAKNLPIGGHNDDHSPEDKTGCGANDQMANIYGIISRKGDAIRQILAPLGVDVSDEIHEHITGAAADRGVFTDPTELEQTLDKADEDAIDTLEGSHNEIVILLNLRDGTTLDHTAAAEELGGETHEAFCVDLWALHDTATALADNPSDQEEVARLHAALLYWNVATAYALCSSEIDVAVVR